MKDLIMVDGNSMSIEDVVAVSRYNKKIGLTDSAKEAIKKSRTYVETFIKDGRVIYGINTGFGKFSDIAIDDKDLEELQEKLILSDTAGIGDPFDTEIVRGIMALRVNALSKGCSGIRLEVVQTLCDMLNKGVHPVIPEKGSVGASGDLIPLAHMVMPMIGMGDAEYKGEIMDGKSAMDKAEIPIVRLQAKEGLALINGTCAMTSVGALATYDAETIIKSADIVASVTLEALEGIIDAFDEKLHIIRPHKGQIDAAYNVRALTAGSGLMTRQGEKRVQDAYSLRCIPQVHGGSRLAFDYIKSVIETEINSATDNPVIFEDSAISGGNFHGQPVAIAMDTLGIAMAEYADISERRIERLNNPALNNGLPAFLTNGEGLNCGFMIPQYAAAAVVSENKILAHPASVDSIPTSANQEDHVSMGTIGARKARVIISHAAAVLGIELMCACQGVDFRNDPVLGKGSKVAYDQLRDIITFMEEDRELNKDQRKAAKLIMSRVLLEKVEQVVPLK